MIQPSEIQQLIRQLDADAQVDLIDKTGMSDHFIIRVVSARFEGVSLMDRHRMVMQCLETALQDGRLHAAEIQTAVN